MKEIPTSAEIRSLYKKDERDENVFEMSDVRGIQVVRRYKSTNPSFLNKRMFIKFFIKEVDEAMFVVGAVSMVEESSEWGGWTIQAPKGFLKRPSNFSFSVSEKIEFDPTDKTVVFEKKKYTLEKFIQLLEKNHLRDMFIFSRIKNLAKTILLHSLFFFADSKYSKMDHFFTEGKSKVTARGDGEVRKPTDPLFHYFYI